MKTVSSSNVIYKFTPNMKEVERISSGDFIRIQTKDCYNNQITSEEQVITEIDYSMLNPATGPIYIEGAMPGDLLQIKIISIDVAEIGIVAVVPNEGVLGDQVTNPITRVIPVKDGYGIFKGIKLPIIPMIGVIGVATAQEDGDCPTDSPWKHGGNMDTKDIKPGSTLYLPVSQQGGMLAIGDCHGIMGDGEISFTGLEIDAEVVLQINVIKDKVIKWPIVETDDSIMVIASGKNIDDAFYEATNQAVNHIKDCLGLEWEDAYALGSLSLDLKVSQIVDPKKTVRAAIPKYLISMDKLIESL